MTQNNKQTIKISKIMYIDDTQIIKNKMLQK